MSHTVRADLLCAKRRHFPAGASHCPTHQAVDAEPSERLGREIVNAAAGARRPETHA